MQQGARLKMDIEPVNWSLVSKAIEFYTSHGFEYIETPWLVNLPTLYITCPNTSRIFKIDDSVGLIGSAEQAFLRLAMDNKLPHTNYVSASPCFRNEPTIDKFHQLQFFKVELFVRVKTPELALFAAKELVKRANTFMPEASVVTTADGWDLEINSIEVGSYGYRYHPFIGYWAYGTGLALPRYTQAIEI